MSTSAAPPDDGIHIHDDRSGLALPRCQDRRWNRTGPCILDHKPRDVWQRFGCFRYACLVVFCSAGCGSKSATEIAIAIFTRIRPPDDREKQALDHAAAARSSLSVPRATIVKSASGNGRCNALASSHGARIHTSYSSAVVRITGMALGWIGSTIAFGAVVRKP